MRRALLSTSSLTLSLVLVGAGAGAATAAESPSPSPSPSVSAPASPTPSAPAPEPSTEPEAPETGTEDDAAVTAVEKTGLDLPTYTCDTDPTDDFTLPADTEGVTYTLEDGVFVATLNEGYEWADWFFSDPWDDPGFDNFLPGYDVPDGGGTDPIAIPVADMAFPNCNHDDETTVDVTTECVDGTGYLAYEVDAPWATAGTRLRIFPYTADEALRGYDVYDGTELSGRLAWDGSSPGQTGDVALDDIGVIRPIFLLGSGPTSHRATVKIDFIAEDDPCLGANPGGADAGTGTAEGGSGEELAATGPEAAWLTAGVAALLVAAGTALVVVARRRQRA
jgi:hypothetical protein